MRILADENVDHPIIRWLVDEDHDVAEVATIDRGTTDARVVQISRETNRILLSFDSDIGRLLIADPEPHPGVIYLRLTGVGPELWSRFAELWPIIEPLASSHFVTVRNGRIRHRPLPLESSVMQHQVRYV